MDVEKQVIILGMHRSGSSLLASICNSLGVNMGSDLLEGLKDNPLGHYEDKCFVKLNEDILKACDASWDLPASFDKTISVKPKFNNCIQDLINSKTGIWGWKDPRTSLTIDLYQPYLTNPVYIWCRRDKLKIANSLFERDGIPIWAGIKIFEIYESRVKEFLSRQDRPQLIVENHKLLMETPKTVLEITEFLKLDKNKINLEEAIGRVKDKKTLAEAKENIINTKNKKHSIFRPLRKYLKKLPVTTGWRYRNLK